MTMSSTTFARVSISRLIVACCLGLGLGLTGCQSVPPASDAAAASAKSGRFTPEQIQALRDEGFVPTDDGWEFSASDRLLFASNEATLTANATQIVQRIGRLLASIGVDSVRIDGHTDAEGTPAYNATLSVRRARAVAEALRQAGLTEPAMTIRGVGEREPVAKNTTPGGRMQNRRVVIIVSS